MTPHAMGFPLMSSTTIALFAIVSAPYSVATFVGISWMNALARDGRAPTVVIEVLSTPPSARICDWMAKTPSSVVPNKVNEIKEKTRKQKIPINSTRNKKITGVLLPTSGLRPHFLGRALEALRSIGRTNQHEDEDSA